MRKSVFVGLAVGLLNLIGCMKDEQVGHEIDPGDYLKIPFTVSCGDYDLKTVNPSLEDESRINWVDIFVSVDDGEFCRHRVVSGEETCISVKRGRTYLLGAVANASSEKWDCNKLVSTSGGVTRFNTTLYCLSENRVGSFVMMTDQFMQYEGGVVNFELKRRVNKCTVRSIKNMWGDPLTFKVVEVYLADVLESWSNDSSVQEVSYNVDGYQTSQVDHLIYARIDKEVAYGEVLNLNESLYYLPLFGSGNYLVVNVLADGVPMSYSFRLPVSQDWNRHYAYDLTIAHAGDEDMIPDAGGSLPVSEVAGTFDVIEWDEVSEAFGF